MFFDGAQVKNKLLKTAAVGESTTAAGPVWPAAALVPA